MLAAYVAFVVALALSSLAFRFVVAGIPPILLAGCLAFYDSTRECWGHHLFGHVDLSSEVAAVCDNWYSGVLQRLVSGVRKSFPRPFVSRVRVRPPAVVTKMCVFDGLQVFLVMLLSCRNHM